MHILQYTKILFLYFTIHILPYTKILFLYIRSIIEILYIYNEARLCLIPLTKNNTVWQHDTVIDVAYHNIYIVACIPRHLVICDMNNVKSKECMGDYFWKQ